MYIMNLFKKLKYLLGNDDFSKIEGVDVLIIRSDSNCYPMPNSNFYYSPQVNVLTNELTKRGYTYLVVAKPFGHLDRSLVKDRALNLSATYSRHAILKFFFPNVRTIFWKKVFKKSKPKRIIAVMPSEGMCNAAHQLNIWLADLQHGVITQSHPYYGTSFVLTKKSHNLPSCFLLWNKNSELVISAWKNEKHVETFIIGNLAFLEPLLLPKSNLLNNIEPKDFILITLQWGLERTPNAEIFFYKNLITQELIKVINLNSHYNWLIRLHPVQQKDAEYIFNQLSKVLPKEVIERSKRYASSPLLSILLQSKLHVTYNSSVTIEAACIGVKTILLDKRLQVGSLLEDYFLDEKNHGSAVVVDDREKDIDLNIEKILKNNTNRQSCDFLEDKHNFFKTVEQLFPKR